MRRTRAQVVAAVAVVLVAALGGCQTGQDDDADAGAPDDAATVSPDDPVSDDDPGTSPEPSEPTEPATPIAADLTVVVDATGEGATTTYTLTCEPVGGDHPDAEFSRTNGCEISRWDALESVFGPDAGLM